MVELLLLYDRELFQYFGMHIMFNLDAVDIFSVLVTFTRTLFTMFQNSPFQRYNKPNTDRILEE